MSLTIVPFLFHLLEAWRNVSLKFTVGIWLSSCRYISKYCGNLSIPRPPWIFSLPGYPHWASSNLSTRVQVSLPRYWFLWWFPLRRLCSSLFAILCIWWLVSLTLGQQHGLCSPLSQGSQKSRWFLNLFSFLLVMIELQIPSSSYMKPEKPLSLYLTNLFKCLKYHLKEYILLNLQYFCLKW